MVAANMRLFICVSPRCRCFKHEFPAAATRLAFADKRQLTMNFGQVIAFLWCSFGARRLPNVPNLLSFRPAKLWSGKRNMQQILSSDVILVAFSLILGGLLGVFGERMRAERKSDDPRNDNIRRDKR
jgi:hypothetical protein